MIEAELKEWGNSTGVILPKEELKKLNVKKGDIVLIDVVKKRIDGFGMDKGRKFKGKKLKPFMRDHNEHDDL
jgi:antitoxin component of MazEF toxin-antitoxin module